MADARGFDPATFNRPEPSADAKLLAGEDCGLKRLKTRQTELVLSLRLGQKQRKPAQPVQYSLSLSLSVCVCVCVGGGVLTSLGSVGKTSENSSKQQCKDEDKSRVFL